MEQCPYCGNVFIASSSHDKQDCFYNLRGSLGYMPDEYKHWKNSMREYRDDWYFLSFSLRHRVAEQKMAFDYLWSLQEWLNPVLTIGKTQKVQAVMVIASIYEGILSEKVNTVVEQKRRDDSLFDSLVYKPRTGIKFIRLIEIAETIKLIDESWAKYLHTIREVRNWVHLSNQQKSKLTSWLESTTYENLDARLNEFKRLAKFGFIQED